MLLFFSVARSQEIGSWERATEVAHHSNGGNGTKVGEGVSSKPKPASKTAANASFGMNMPLMSSAFDTAMWLNAA
jgi:hypothetical protein